MIHTATTTFAPGCGRLHLWTGFVRRPQHPLGLPARGAHSSRKMTRVFRMSLAAMLASAGVHFASTEALSVPGVATGSWVTAKDAVAQAAAFTTGTWTGLCVWTIASMFLYAARRSQVHGLPKRLVLSRHFVNGFDEPPHPYFAVAFAGWLLFLFAYVPLELFLFLFARCSVFYYYYPAACGAGLMVEKLNPSRSGKVRNGAETLSANQRQLIRFDWHRFKICVSGRNQQNRYCGESLMVNLPHIDLPGHSVKHWPWKHHMLRDVLRRIYKIPLKSSRTGVHATSSVRRYNNIPLPLKPARIGVEALKLNDLKTGKDHCGTSDSSQ